MSYALVSESSRFGPMTNLAGEDDDVGSFGQSFHHANPEPSPPQTQVSPTTDNSKESAKQGGKQHTPSKETKDSPKSPMEENIARLQGWQRHKVKKMPHIHDPNGDTLIFITIPDHLLQGWLREDFEEYRKHLGQAKRMDSDRLSKASPYLANMLMNPTYKFKTSRQLLAKNLLTSLDLPVGIKFVLQLSPPDTLDDHAGVLVASLSCPETVRFWSLSQSTFNVSTDMAGGFEEHDYASALDELAKDPGPLPYSAVRHNSAIERILVGIQGNMDPQLDSAVKMWSVTVIAKHFRVTKMTAQPFFDYISRWLRAEPNSLFLEVNPEICLQVGDTFQDESISRDAFAILVGEEALDSLIRARLSKEHDILGKNLSAFKRRTSDVPEVYTDRIQYASQSFVERIVSDFETFAEAEWIECMDSVWSMKHGNDGSDCQDYQQAVAELVLLLKQWVCGAIYKILLRQYSELPGPFNPNKKSEDSILMPCTERHTVWNKLAPKERLLTGSFWQALHDMTPAFRSAYSNFELGNGWEDRTFIAAPINHFACYENEYGNKMNMVNVLELKSAILKVTKLRSPRESATQASNTGPEVKAEVEPLMSLQVAQSHNKAAASQDASDPIELDADEERVDSVLDLKKFFTEAACRVRAFALEKLAPSDQGSEDRPEPYQCKLMNTLTCLTESEWKYLPLFAGGDDDGSGAVFSGDVAEAPPGTTFSTAGPRVRLGEDDSSSTSTVHVRGSDSFSVVSTNEINSTVHHNSLAVEDGVTETSSTAPHLDRHRVYSVPSSSASLVNGMDGLATGSVCESEMTDLAESGVLLRRLDINSDAHGEVTAGAPDPQQIHDETEQQQSTKQNQKENNGPDESYDRIFQGSDEEMDFGQDDDDNDNEMEDDDYEHV